ncbi:DHH family phosphoesterase [Limosilactobacillus difficilis]|uniref:DHH family phosphoesterase n=1 Tax=Limosilactobacillus difficilis TaxID=2991838 RepID=UPI0024BAF46A|nr:DHH family phosphoesterase [Limosilactobacillus difficilis]
MKDFFNGDRWLLFVRDGAVRANAIFLLSLSIISLVIAFNLNWVIGLIMVVFLAVGLYISLNQLYKLRDDTNTYLSDLTYQLERGQQEALLDMPLGMITMDDHEMVKWINPYMAKYFKLETVVGKPLSDVDFKLAKLVKKYQQEKQPLIVSWKRRRFEFLVQERFHTIYLMDVTRYQQIEERYKNERVFVGQIYLDNYIELTQGMNDSEVSNLHNYVTSEISKWAKVNHLLMKVIDDDNYLIVGYQRSLDSLEKKKFKILDVIRNNTTKQNSPVTLSVGIAYGEHDLMKMANTAQQNLDLALGRGGDQVVVRAEDSEARFYGGKTNPMEKRTRVRARMISQAMQELMAEADQIFVMGHNKPDMDSMGACLGIRRIASMNSHNCWIVLDTEHVHSDIARLMLEINKYKDIKDHIITPDEAMAKATSKSLLVMVDHSKPSISISPKLFQQLQNRVMIIDHHRRGEEFPENPLLVYIEPYASSTCELITEMFEYQPRDSESLNKLEATTMLTGIQVDTKSFTQRAGTRTFDAASYLRSAGADGLMIQHFMKENPDSFLNRNHLISNVKFINDRMALCVGEDNQSYDPVTAAQAADMLLQMDGIDASFVITKRADNVISVSARSMGDFNVQLVMEKMGGGGHLSNAATQIKGKTVSQVRDELVDLLNHKEDSDSDLETTEE